MRPRSTASIGCLLAGLVLLLPAGTARSSQAAASGDAGTGKSAVSLGAEAESGDDELEEVLVRGTRLWQLREAIVEAEDRLYARYNELNKNRDFDIHCRREAPIGTRLKKRICQVRFFEDAQAEYARALVTGSGYAPDPNQVMMQRQGEFHANATGLYKNDRRLRALSRELERLQKNYEKERRERFKDRWFEF
jgi:hypothetical protein